VTLSLIVICCIRLVWGQDEGENANIRYGDNPYIFLYYDIEEKLDDFYNLRESIKSDTQLLESGNGVPFPPPPPPPPDPSLE
jgi:hypothetical protein